MRLTLPCGWNNAGRSQEVAGEDPTLTASYAASYVKGMQAHNTSRYLTSVPVCKHFRAYDFEGGTPSGFPADVDRFHVDVNVSKRDMAEYYLKPLRACVVEGGAQGVMCAYPSINGVPSCADGVFQNELMRKAWGFQGFVVSDAGATELTGMPRRHPRVGQPASDAASFNFTASLEETVTATLLGGLDLDLPEGSSNGPLVMNGSVVMRALGAATRFGTLREEDVRRSARRVLRTSFLLGELDGPERVPQQRWGAERVDSPAHRALALRAARASIVLLANVRHALPLSRAASGVAFVGPQANVTQGFLSDYHGLRMDMDTQSPLHLARARGLAVEHAQGCGLNSGAAENASAIGAAVALAARSSVVVLFLGLCGNNRAGPDGTPGCSGGAKASESEGVDRTSLELPGAQQELLARVLASGTPTIVVLVTGATLALDTAGAAAVVYAPYGGQAGGAALLDVLLGDANPSGKSPVTWYRADFVHSRQPWDMDLRTGDGVTHMHYTKTPLWKFGTGLSYTQFEYAFPAPGRALVPIASLLGSAHSAAATWVPRVRVANTGARQGEVVVLGFVQSSHREFARQKLFDFQRITLAPAESATLQLRAAPDTLAVVDSEGRAWLRPAQITVRIGDVLAPATASFELAGDPTLVTPG